MDMMWGRLMDRGKIIRKTLVLSNQVFHWSASQRFLLALFQLLKPNAPAFWKPIWCSASRTWAFSESGRSIQICWMQLTMSFVLCRTAKQLFSTADKGSCVHSKTKISSDSVLHCFICDLRRPRTTRKDQGLVSIHPMQGRDRKLYQEGNIQGIAFQKTQQALCTTCIA